MRRNTNSVVTHSDYELAEILARQDRVDLHELLQLVDRGCPPPLAARILAPLEEDVREP